jgi:hypothetical protein
MKDESSEGMKDESSEPKNGLFALTALEWMISSGARSSNPPRLVPREVILEMLEDALRILEEEDDEGIFALDPKSPRDHPPNPPSAGHMQ